MVNYDTHNGFSVSSVLMSSDEHHESTAVHKHTQPANTTVAHTHKNAVGSSSTGGGGGGGGGAGTGRTKKPTLQAPSISVLTINDVNFLHVGNYTCAPSNAKQASITVHVLRGKCSSARGVGWIKMCNACRARYAVGPFLFIVYFINYLQHCHRINMFFLHMFDISIGLPCPG